MAGNIKGITIEFQGETTKLEQAIRKVNSSTKEIDKNLKDVNRALKFNPTSIELWRQKQDLLEKKIKETEKNLTSLKNMQSQMDANEVDKQSTEYQQLQREIIETESKLKTFNQQLKEVGNVNLRAASEQFKQWGGSLTEAGQKMQGLSMAAGALVASLGAISYKAGQNADDLNTLSKVYSINTTDLQKYSVAADLVDVSVEDIAKSHVKLEKSMYSAQNGSSSMQEAFDKLGVSITDSNGELRDGDAVWQDAISALGQMSNDTERDALAMQLMGKSAAQLNPLIEDQGEMYKNLTDTLKEYDLDFVDQETLDKANQFNDSLDTMKAIGSVALATVGSQLAGYLAPALEKVVGWIGQLAGWLSSLSPQVLTVIGVVAAVVAGIAPVLLILGKLAFAISSIMSLMSTLGLSFGMLAGPVGIAIAVIAALIAIGVLLYKNWDKIKAKAAEIKASLVATWNNIKTSVSNAVNNLKTTMSNVWNSIKSTATSVWNSIKTAITTPITSARDKVKSIIDKIKGYFPLSLGKLLHFSLPKITIGSKSKTIMGKTISVPDFNISWASHARGGIFDRPTLLTDTNGGLHQVGEAGPEAILPLKPLWDKLDALAGNGTTEININIYGSEGQSAREIAEEVKQMLITESKRRRLAWQ